ncbi:PepSY domain-containing protein [Pseudoroseomonas cervicalis]|nr:PepSY domain-containing protein [Pseudoroseomonas cervicalis]
MPLSRRRALPALLLSGLMLAGAALPVLAAPPPPNARPLSEILRIIEQRDGVVYFDEVEWDSDGYWEVEYYTRDGAKREIRVDPVSGETLRR